MHITGVVLNFNEEKRPGVGDLLAVASVEVDGEFLLRRIRIVKYPDNTLSIFLPSRMRKDQQREDYFFFKNAELKREVYTKVFEGLERELSWRKQEDDLRLVRENKRIFFDRIVKAAERSLA